MVLLALVLLFIAILLLTNYPGIRHQRVLPGPSYHPSSAQLVRTVKFRNASQPNNLASGRGFASKIAILTSNAVASRRCSIRISPSEPVLVAPARIDRPFIVISPQPTTVSPSETVQVGLQVIVAHAEPLVISRQAAIVIEPTPARDIVVRPSWLVPVEPPVRGAWDERGWTRRTANGQELYEGLYQVVERRTRHPRLFNGRIRANRRQITAYIADPPREIKKHPHGSCFQLHSAPWFQLHWRRAPQNVDDAILYMERVLDESINNS